MPKRIRVNFPKESNKKYFSFENEKYKKILPPLSLLSDPQQKELMSKLRELEFFPERKAA